MGNKELEGVAPASQAPGHRPSGVEPQSSVSSKAGTPNAWTPGPWALFGTEDKRVDRCGIEALDPKLSIVVFGRGDDNEGVFGRDEAEALANARLIAAAPDMFEALEKLVDAVRFDVDKVRRIERAEAILAKARGEQP